MPEAKTDYLYKGNHAYLSLTLSQRQVFENYLFSTRFIFNTTLSYLIKKEENEKISSSKETCLKEVTVLLQAHEEKKPLLCQYQSLYPIYIKNAFEKYKKATSKGKKPRFASFLSPKQKIFVSFFDSNPQLDIVHQKFTLKGIGTMSLRGMRPFTGYFRSFSLYKKGDKQFYLTFKTTEKPSPLPLKKKRAIGLDLGLKDYLITSEGKKIANPQIYRKKLRRLKHCQHMLSKCQYGSKSYYKQKAKLQRMYRHLVDYRNDFLHKLSKRLIREASFLSIEDLDIKKFLGKRLFSLSFFDASFGEFVKLLEYKAKWNKRELVKIDRFYPSSKRCHVCGHLQENLTLNDREWTCAHCHTHHDRDINAAINILIEGIKTYCKKHNKPIPEKYTRLPFT